MADVQARRRELATELREEARKLLASRSHTDNPEVKRGLARQAFALVQSAELHKQIADLLTKDRGQG
jgi:hypothetical protein